MSKGVVHKLAYDPHNTPDYFTLEKEAFLSPMAPPTPLTSVLRSPSLLDDGNGLSPKEEQVALRSFCAENICFFVDVEQYQLLCGHEKVKCRCLR